VPFAAVKVAWRVAGQTVGNTASRMRSTEGNMAYLGTALAVLCILGTVDKKVELSLGIQRTTGD
jgi:hypothetical protein